ncbi:hypothetical protein IFM62136_06574 [Aspergillus lentulus]|nr:hypothetical protein IFM62136_06574 [Aspergillus lentulus]
MASSSLPSNGRLVNMGTRSLAPYTHGPEPSSFEEPVVLFISGVANATLTTVPAITTQETSPLAPSAENVAREVSLLIEMAHECIALKGTDQIASLVLVDANPETAALVMNVNDPIFWTVAADVDPYSAWGVEAEHKLTWEKWDAFRAAEAAEKYKLIARKEDFENYMPNFETLRKKELTKGNGTEEQRSYVRELIKTVDAKNEGLMKKSLKLSTKSAPVFATESGHCLQMAQPEFVVDGVKWVLHNLPASS